MSISLFRQVVRLERLGVGVRGRVCGTCGKAAVTGAESVELRVPMPAIMGADESVPSEANHAGCAECGQVIVLTVPPPRRFGEA